MELVVDGMTIDLGPSEQRGIIAAMLAEPERPISTEALVDRVWDDPPDTVRHSVYTYMTRLRRILRTATAHSEETAAIGRTVGGYRLDVDPHRIDLFGFRRLLNRSRAMDADHPDRAGLLTLALGMWRGEPLAGLDSDWALRFRESLRQLRHEALVEWADASLRLGQLKVVATELRKALLESPLAEDLHQRLLTSYYLDNRGAEALSHYDRMRRRFAAELGVDPGQRLRELHELLLGKQEPNTIAVIPVSPRRAEPPSPANAFRGRTVEIARMQRLLAEPSTPTS
ncbi:AfsR/SARP family transcriptional regulator [Nocardia sp. CA-119907]|uniref:AfsR/SARP family transcriptional regulator n=1 Tax=Nocardia sp. CA-119907 TaxID=3239973 RepID=UPI003D987A69